MATAGKAQFVTVDGAAHYGVLTNPVQAKNAIAGFRAQASPATTGQGAGR